MTTREMLWTRESVLLFQTFVMSLLCHHSCCACDQNEYEIDGICCRKCSPGSRVSRHCTKQSTGHCAPCLDSTFSETPNALKKCHPCTVCAEDRGLKTVKECMPSSDTVCGVLNGHYCIDRYGEGCREAKEHTTCKPGQSIRRPGTEYNDAVCEACSDHSYSNGSFTSCKPHTDCASRGLVTVKSGNHSSDSQCGERSRALVIVVTVGLILTIGGVVLCIYIRKNGNQKGSPPQKGQVDQRQCGVEHCSEFSCQSEMLDGVEVKETLLVPGRQTA
ncbi:tumor necrosis factor receptor superfamily member 5-like isoform X1 [Brienomyrus brachyistius]|uniref:tumor necrosis factor receptor superfamily member 5-like isoform X1 n=2 Tax=Brienomyrus brachyistius TaxID=42636 RepID=UPI0020B290BE|nr:tumor necrosis factor receptor superfamily member 5-like isoform X1 [Brienomyrus brachyistius]